MSMVSTINCEEVLILLESGELQLIDVREEDEYAAERISRAIFHPLSSFNPALLLPVPDKSFVFSCRSGGRSLRAAKLWAAFWNSPCYNLKGGILEWKEKGIPL